MTIIIVKILYSSRSYIFIIKNLNNYKIIDLNNLILLWYYDYFGSENIFVKLSFNIIYRIFINLVTFMLFYINNNVKIY